MQVNGKTPKIHVEQTAIECMKIMDDFPFFKEPKE